MAGVHRDSIPTADEASLRELSRVAGIEISLEDMPAVVAKCRELAAQLSELDLLDLSEVVPASGFDPAWEGQR